MLAPAPRSQRCSRRHPVPAPRRQLVRRTRPADRAARTAHACLGPPCRTRSRTLDVCRHPPASGATAQLYGEDPTPGGPKTLLTEAHSEGPDTAHAAARRAPLRGTRAPPAPVTRATGPSHQQHPVPPAWRCATWAAGACEEPHVLSAAMARRGGPGGPRGGRRKPPVPSPHPAAAARAGSSRRATQRPPSAPRLAHNLVDKGAQGERGP